MIASTVPDRSFGLTELAAFKARRASRHAVAKLQYADEFLVVRVGRATGLVEQELDLGRVIVFLLSGEPGGLCT